ncbi:extracellular ribonuclease LE-like isoform X2 [Amborella trichopoda]|uniref:extracellular ribonuclease LE-like isoform X2 n=1 Tax=Amborella trichopoda TaxID=13333 RepID=UPI0009BD283D|nr:extracellular ribonuclease LE-like isoform X2 [Amborella trichopoda]|eukprot:XP_020531655.1 extracellular ribonuclease LE-like isoform X2 [Amborella trichopoda]
MAHEQWLLLALVGLGMRLQAMLEDFNFYYYWPGSYCAQSSKRCCLPTTGEPDEDFFVVGLYAANSTEAVLRKCPNEQSFEFSQLEGLEESLSGLWSSIKCPSNTGQSMWKSLWKNNGVCSNLSLFKYFKQGIIIHREINLIKALRFQSIVPNGRLYQLAEIKKALKHELGAEVAIRCRENSNSMKSMSGSTKLMPQVCYLARACLTLNALTRYPSLPSISKCSRKM